MRKIIGYLFPWQPTFRRLELEKRWWHRLAVVLFFVALIPAFVFSWALGDDATAPTNSFLEGIQYWQILPSPPAGYTLEQTVNPITSLPDAESIGNGKIAVPLKDIFDVVTANAKEADMRKTVQMPDGKTATFPGTTSDETIKAEWNHKLQISTAKAAFLGFGIAVLVTVIFSYLFQASYRAVLYVIFGAKAGDTGE